MSFSSPLDQVRPSSSGTSLNELPTNEQVGALPQALCLENSAAPGSAALAKREVETLPSTGSDPAADVLEAARNTGVKRLVYAFNGRGR